MQMRKGRSGWLVLATLLTAVALAGGSLGLSGCGRRPPATPTYTKTPALAASIVSVATSTPTATPTRTVTPTPTITPTPTRNPLINPLTGLPVGDASVLQRRPILARIGNDPSIRPQAGLSEADVVYEEIMDGWWVTRLTAIFLSQDPETIGPIRSARLICIELANQYQGALVHSGASDQVRWLISQEDFVNLDEYFHPTPFYYIEGASWMGRLFTSAPAVRKYMETQGFEGAPDLSGFSFSEEVPEGEVAREVDIPYPDSSRVMFRYDEQRGVYLRWVQGQPHTDRTTGEQLAVSNVVVMFCEHQRTDIVEDSRGATSIRIVMMGEGPLYLARDGVLVKGTWRREQSKEMARFLDEDGNELLLKPGQTWVEVVPLDYEIGYGG